jgi:exodeoxyribonuclease V alpha subunit
MISDLISRLPSDRPRITPSTCERAVEVPRQPVRDTHDNHLLGVAPVTHIVVGMRNVETAAPPADLEARRIHVVLAESGPRFVSADLEFAVWTASIGESREGELVTLAGPLGHLTAGEQLVCSGAFARHPRYGWQFSVESFRSVLPSSPEGVMRWLMARVAGIGPAFARAIVNHFGAGEVFMELDRRPERLQEVRTRSGRAFSRKSVERAIAAWRELATVRDVETFLFSHGIGAGLAARLVRRYGDEVVDVLTHDPYRLIELPRVGFKIADGIARSLGVELDDPQRLRAGLVFVLEEAEADGNTFLPLTELWRRAGTLLGVGELDPLESALRALAASAEIVVEGERVYRIELWEMECRLAEIVGERVGAEPGELFERPRRLAVDVSDEQWAVVELVRTRPLVLLTGLPGAGKTHTQRALVEISRRARKRVLLCAPTGKAARRMRDLTGREAMTIHRALGYSPNEGGFQRDERWPLSRDYDLIIVDEASMLSSWPTRSSVRSATVMFCSSVTPTSCRRSAPGACSPISSTAAPCRVSICPRSSGRRRAR